MCGIAGIIHRESDPNLQEKIVSSVERLSHRGPDDCGTWIDKKSQVGLGNARLAVIDLAGGHQPLHLVGVPVTVVMNGEIYNHRSIRRQLEAEGREFRTDSDTEVVGQALDCWGVSGLKRLNGMFAVAVFDERTDTVLVARDRVGIKPLYVYEHAGGWAFASEPKAICDWPVSNPRINSDGLLDYMALGYTWAGSSIVEGLREIAPGSWWSCSHGVVDEGNFWAFTPQERDVSAQAIQADVKSTLIASIEEHLVADVPLGCFLSGGIDSSVVAAILHRELGMDIPTFTVSFGGHAYDEVSAARAVAAHIGAEHHIIEVNLGAGDPDLVEMILDHFDLPFADSSAIPTWLVSEAIRKEVKVAIGGDGGDEAFGGYRRFRHADYARRLGALPNGLIQTGKAIAGAAFSVIRPEWVRGIGRLSDAASVRDTRRFLPLSAIIRPSKLHEIMKMDSRRIDAWWNALQHRLVEFDDPGGQEFREFTFGTALHGDYLRKVDMASSAHGLEVRVPLLGNQVLDLSETLPWSLTGGAGQGKVLLRNLACELLPQSVVKRRKQGFSIPLHRWFDQVGRQEVVRRVGSYIPAIADVVDVDSAHDLLGRFARVSAGRSMSEYGMYQRVYQLWSLARWAHRHNPVWPS